MRILILPLLILCSHILGRAQVPVFKEPLHHLVLTKPNARVLDVMANPGDTSLMHVHANNYVYVSINGGELWLDEDGATRNLKMPDDYVGGYFQNPTRALIHRFSNISKSAVRLIAIEHISHNGNVADSLYTAKRGEELVLDNEWFRVLKVAIQPNDRLVFNLKYPSVSINLSDSPLPARDSKVSETLPTWEWHNAHSDYNISNESRSSIKVAIVQLKE